MLGKKANAAVILLALILIIIVVYWIVNLSSRECNHDDECGTDRYCGSDFKCHDKIINRVEYSLMGPALVVGFAIVIGAIILRWKGR